MENIEKFHQRSRIKVQIFRAIILVLIPLILYACKEAETAGFTISSISGNTGEDLTPATFTVRLNSQPDGDVVIDLSSSDSTEGSVSSTPLTFTSLNWSDDQTVDVSGVNDDQSDGNQHYAILLTINSGATVETTGYAALDPASITVVNVDDDDAGFTISNISGNTGEDLSTATFTVRLNNDPDGDVVIDLSSDNSSEGKVISTPLTFTRDNWSVDQTVDVIGVDDDLADGNQSYSIQLTINSGLTAVTSGYAALDSDSVPVINVDDDTIGVKVIQNGRFTNESGTSSVFFSVSLESQPYFDVTIPLSSSNTDEGSLLVSSLTFTSADWDTSQDVTVSGEDDSSFDTAQLYTILLSAASSSDSSYDGYDPTDLTLYNLDDEYKLPDTGQTANYISTTGEDSDTLINEPSYTYDINTVTDDNTGLIWQRQDDNIKRNWADAGTYCDNLDLVSQSDWRLPDKKELASIADYGNTDPAIDTEAFPGTKSSGYWSSTTNYRSYAWHMNFEYGAEDSRDDMNYVRCVRSGPSSTALFSDLGDQTVLDRKTGLLWQQTDDDINRNWEAAIIYCDGLSLTGKSDWRLPNARELGSIFDNNESSPAIDTTAFPGTNLWSYWSSTTYANDDSRAWLGEFRAGKLNHFYKADSSRKYVRCVRSAQ